LNDPPFSQMDLICCRNLLIYLEPVLQSKAISLFHYAARPNGFLVLGASEGVGSASGLFATEDRTYKIFSKKASAARQAVTFSLNRQADRAEYGIVRTPTRQPDSSLNYLEAQKEFDRRLVTHYAPATVFINDELEIVHSRGNINRYLKLSPGRASLSILKMAREGLLLELRNAIGRAKKENTAVRKTDVVLKNDNGNGAENGSGDAHHKLSGPRHISFEVMPIHLGQLKELYFMIVFREEQSSSSPVRAAKPSKKERQETELTNGRITKLE